jgi:adenosylcobinamide-GDP ribazoletransferase
VAVIALAVWALITGGLHLDGLADAADAWIGGFGDREKSLAIMKDPRSGPIAVVVVVLVLLGKFAALQTLVAHAAWSALLITPVLGRAAIIWMVLTTPYVRPEGVGIAHAEHLPRAACRFVLLGLGIIVLGWFGWQGVALLVMLGVALYGLRSLLMQRLGGATGDTLGAACELTEAASLLLLASFATP